MMSVLRVLLTALAAIGVVIALIRMPTGALLALTAVLCALTWMSLG